ncbi:hypothetical protein LOTGIDRAFT_121100 [Lottia gigantea]|uniref:DET1 partner of COP1 E3 ubiquitin ligase n=1 Tax=Lottia gigantea TaxID=225164 RepID=V4AGA1_LOTGI|nr:hypothetical protein LOTGIDRAFT_121100 [Lottia gigantea]ESO92436.1 hypothetical protein LOTGIDRAFT_121100 [Lottia gigantea]
MKCEGSAEGCSDGENTEDGIKPRKIPNQNIVTRLIRRETHLPKQGTHFHQARRFYTNVFPNFTITNVEKPPCFLRKFSPDGHYFVAFSSDQTSIEIYEFQGSQAVEDLLCGIKGDNLGSGNDDIRRNLFKRFFKLKHVTLVATDGEHLNRECSLFTDDGNFVIVGSAVYLPEDPHPLFFDIYKNNESVSPNSRSPLEDYSLHLVELETGRLCDRRKFKCDKIFLSHNQGIYLYKTTLAVLSVQQQTIHIFHVTPQGSFIDIRSIGRFCFEDDELFLRECLDPQVRQNLQRPFYDKLTNSLKHRLLTFLYYKAKDDPYQLRLFYTYFDQFKALRMWKMQLLDENHLLIKYAEEDVVTLRTPNMNSEPSFIVAYNMSKAEVMAVYENTSEELLSLVENFCDMFRNATIHSSVQFTCSVSNNTYARQFQERYKQSIIKSKYGSQTEAIRHLLAQLPISSQSYSNSPYVDLALFSYDDKWISAMERPKGCGEHPIRFYARDSGLLKFKIHAGFLGRNPPPTARRLVAFTFHPSEPFAISVQRTNSEYVVNFHVRHSFS